MLRPTALQASCTRRWQTFKLRYMKQLISISLLLFILATSMNVCAQSKTSETLTILIDWEPNGKNKVYISEAGKEPIEKTLVGKFQEKELSLVSKSLNDLLN